MGSEKFESCSEAKHLIQLEVIVFDLQSPGELRHWYEWKRDERKFPHFIYIERDYDTLRVPGYLQKESVRVREDSERGRWAATYKITEPRFILHFSDEHA